MPKARSVKRSLTPTSAELHAATRPLHAVPVRAGSRTAALQSYTPAPGKSLPSSVKSTVIGLVLAVPFKSTTRDLDLLATLTGLVQYDLHIHGSFDPGRAMSEAGLSRWRREELDRRGVSQRSQGDYCSRIRTILQHSGLAPHLADRDPAPRGVAAAPADPRAWTRVVDSAVRMGGPYEADVIMLADLTFGAGARPDEVGRLRGDDLFLLTNGEGRLTLTNKHGAARDVPIGPYVTQRILRAQRRPTEELVRPGITRHNMINRLFTTTAKRSASTKFDLNAARNRFIVNLLAQPLPFSVVCHLADLSPGGHTAQDLSRFATLPSQDKIAEYMRETWR
jgi:hypothetical protein